MKNITEKFYGHIEELDKDFIYAVMYKGDSEIKYELQVPILKIKSGQIKYLRVGQAFKYFTYTNGDVSKIIFMRVRKLTKSELNNIKNKAEELRTQLNWK